MIRGSELFEVLGSDSELMSPASVKKKRGFHMLSEAFSEILWKTFSEIDPKFSKICGPIISKLVVWNKFFFPYIGNNHPN